MIYTQECFIYNIYYLTSMLNKPHIVASGVSVDSLDVEPTVIYTQGVISKELGYHNKYLPNMPL